MTIEGLHKIFPSFLFFGNIANASLPSKPESICKYVDAFALDFFWVGAGRRAESGGCLIV